MKLYKYCLIISSVILFFTSCDKETEGVSRITYYVDLELKGASQLFWPKGTAFVDPGVIAISNGEDVSGDVILSGSVNTNKPGTYPLKYSSYNEDGFAKEAVRTVYVYETDGAPITSTFWNTSPDSYRNSGGTITRYGSSYPIIINQEEPGLFYISDFLGGFYQYRAGYGAAFTAQGYFRLKEDNTLEFISGDVEGWGDSVTKLVDAKYDPETNTLSWGAEYVGMTFYVTITNN